MASLICGITVKFPIHFNCWMVKAIVALRRPEPSPGDDRCTGQHAPAWQIYAVGKMVDAASVSRSLCVINIPYYSNYEPRTNVRTSGYV